jgi:hypothetical protein
MKSYSDVIEALNEKYLNEFCWEAGLAFVYFDSQWMQAICFCEWRLWTTEDDDCCDEDGEMDWELLFAYCCGEYEEMVEMISSKINKEKK